MRITEAHAVALMGIARDIYVVHAEHAGQMGNLMMAYQDEAFRKICKTVREEFEEAAEVSTSD